MGDMLSRCHRYLDAVSPRFLPGATVLLDGDFFFP